MVNDHSLYQRINAESVGGFMFFLLGQVIAGIIVCVISRFTPIYFITPKEVLNEMGMRLIALSKELQEKVNEYEKNKESAH
jgi:hypothetical protein